MRPFEDPYFCWKATTRAGTIASVVVVRETIKKSRATVTVALRLTNGDSVMDSERLVRTSRGWLIGESGALQKDKMRRTGSPKAKRRGHHP
jgi:hypothetical protein